MLLLTFAVFLKRRPFTMPHDSTHWLSTCKVVVAPSLQGSFAPVFSIRSIDHFHQYSLSAVHIYDLFHIHISHLLSCSITTRIICTSILYPQCGSLALVFPIGSAYIWSISYTHLTLTEVSTGMLFHLIWSTIVFDSLLAAVHDKYAFGDKRSGYFLYRDLLNCGDYSPTSFLKAPRALRGQ